MNKAWHDKHPMPKNATTAERIKWHKAHAKHCACRPIPEKLLEKINSAKQSK